MTRRGAAVLAVLALLAGVGAWLWARRPAPRTGPSWLAGITKETRRTRPNLLFVVYDARRRDDFSFGPFGNRRNDTPFLASLAGDALVFEDAVAPGCWTVPVHASIFSGLPVCELGIEYYNPGFAAFDQSFLSLAEILQAAGYHTIAYPDHPFFYAGSPQGSLVRGFEQFNVINDFQRFTSRTNVADPAKASRLIEQLGPFRHLSLDEIDRLVASFNTGELALPPETDVDRDPGTGMLFARLEELFAASPYFARRYQQEMDAHVFGAKRERPYFLFLNLHMCDVAEPDPELFERWYLQTVMLNARRAGRKLTPGPQGSSPKERLEAMYRGLRLPHAPQASPGRFMKHVFDNRFYDATFHAMWGYLAARGLLENTVTLVASDHGLSFGEMGEPYYLHGGARPHEYMVRVPLVVKFPEGSRLKSFHGRHRERISLTDLFATMTDLGLGPGVFKRSRPIHGQSLIRRLVTGEFDDVVVSECSQAPNPYRFLPNTACYAKAVYAGRFKLIYGPRLFATTDAWPIRVRLEAPWPYPEAPPPHRELDHPFSLLYDLERDPHETTDLSPASGDRVKGLHALAGGWACDGRGQQEAPTWDAEALETLRSLGYVH